MTSISYSAVFLKNMKRLAKKYKSFPSDLAELCRQLNENPFMGTDLGNGVRKIRMAVKSKGKGKSGGVRIISFNVIISTSQTNITLLTAYDKSETENISDKEIKALLSSISSETL